jgi:AcrR family transcriptional regulator
MIDQTSSIGNESRRERRFQRQRKMIMDAAAQLFAQKGYKATTTKDIAQALDIGESTLYGYFSSKQEVLQAILSRQAEMVDSLLIHLNEHADRQSIVDIVDLLMEKILTEVIYNRVVIAEAWTDDEVLQGFVLARWQPILALLQDFIESRIASGAFRPIDAGLGARMVTAFFIAAVLPVLRGVAPPPSAHARHALAETIVELISNGFIARGG